MNHCRNCNSDYSAPGTCNCFAPQRMQPSYVPAFPYYPPWCPWRPVPVYPMWPASPSWAITTTTAKPGETTWVTTTAQALLGAANSGGM